MTETIFNLVGAKSYTTAKPVIEVVTEKLLKKVKLDQLELLGWEDDVIVYHGITKKSRRSVYLTVEKDGTVYARMDGQDNEIVAVVLK